MRIMCPGQGRERMGMAERRMRTRAGASLLEKLLVRHAGRGAGTHLDAGGRGGGDPQAPAAPETGPQGQAEKKRKEKVIEAPRSRAARPGRKERGAVRKRMRIGAI